MSARLILLSLLFLLVITLPFVYAAGSVGPNAVFGGFLFNPQDGNTYLAKMYQGWQGSWQYRLPFTADPGPGVYLFIFYNFLGHLARWTGLSLLLTFHLARLVGAVGMLAALWRFLDATCPSAWRGWAYAVALFGLGLGWLIFPLGHIASDFWVADAYPFLCAYTTPHFVISLALVLALLTLPVDPLRRPWTTALTAGLAGLALSLLSPFGLVVAVLGLSGTLVLNRFHPPAGAPRIFSGGWWGEFAAWVAAPRARSAGLRLIGAVIGSVPFSIYNQWVVRSHPQLAVWNAQNQTWTPPAWDILLAFSPVILLALPGAVRIVRKRIAVAYPLLAWAVLVFGVIYVPLNLQRRFMIGWYIPLTALAAYGMSAIAASYPTLSRRLALLAFGLALPTTLLMLVLGLMGIWAHEPSLYLSANEAHALEWLEANSPPDSLVLASPEMGLLVPAHTGRRVIVGHLYETVNYKAEEQAVLDFFASRQPDQQAFLFGRGVDYVIYGPWEGKIGPMPTGLPLEPVFTSGDVTLYRVLTSP